MQKRDYYEVLGVERNVFEFDIKKVYWKLVLKYYLDKNLDNKEVEEKFKEVVEVYEVFFDVQKCLCYDQFGYVGMGGVGFGGGGMNMDDIFFQFGDIFGGVFGGSFGGVCGGGQCMVCGINFWVKMKLMFEEVVEGVCKKIKVNKLVNVEGVIYKNCLVCNGIGCIICVVQMFFGVM